MGIYYCAYCLFLLSVTIVFCQGVETHMLQMPRSFGETQRCGNPKVWEVKPKAHGPKTQIGPVIIIRKYVIALRSRLTMSIEV